MNTFLKFKSKAMLRLENCNRASATCGGPKACKNRKYDPKRKDCKECSSDAFEAMKEALCMK